MKQRTITGFFFVLIMLLFLIPGKYYNWISALLLPLIGAGTAYEMYKVFPTNEKPPKVFWYAAILAFIPGAVYALLRPVIRFDGILRYCLLSAILFIFFAMYIFFKPIITEGPEKLYASSIYVLAAVYLFIPLFLGVLLLLLPHGWTWFLVAVITPWISDTAAYLTGYFWGKKPLIPKLSPKKTYAGFWGGSISVAILYAILSPLCIVTVLPKLNPFILILFGFVTGFVIGIISQLGDWAASAIKRVARIKDFSQLIPGHGGILDRFDSFLFTVSAICLLALSTYALQRILQ